VVFAVSIMVSALGDMVRPLNPYWRSGRDGTWKMRWPRHSSSPKAMH
jgi:hypothetical protein